MKRRTFNSGDKMPHGCWTRFNNNLSDQYLRDGVLMSIGSSVNNPDQERLTPYKQTAHPFWTPDCGISRRKSWGSHSSPGIYRDHRMRADVKKNESRCNAKAKTKQRQDLKSQMFVPGSNSAGNQNKAMANKLRVRKLNSEKKAIADKARADKARADARAKILMTVVETTPVETTPVETTAVETTPVETTPVETTPVETTAVDTADRSDTVYPVHFLMTKPVRW